MVFILGQGQVTDNAITADYHAMVSSGSVVVDVYLLRLNVRGPSYLGLTRST